MEESGTIYILLKDRAGEPLKIPWHTMTSPTQVLRGELLEALPEVEQPQDSLQKALVGLDCKKPRLVCPTEDLARLSDEDANLLLAISSLAKRYDIFSDKKRLDIGRRIQPGTRVFLNVRVKGILKDLVGVVRCKSEFPRYLGTMFGVELTENPGQGNSDGMFQNKRYFTCGKDCGVFVPLDKIKLKDSDIRSPKSPKNEENVHSNAATGLEREFSRGAMATLLEIDQRVVIFQGDEPVRGTVRYIGEGKYPSGHPYTIVGLELDLRIGSGNGKRNGKQRFVCRWNFAIFVPLDTVIPEKDFDGSPQGCKKTNEQGAVAVQQGTSSSQGLVDIPQGLEVGSMVEVPMTESVPRYGVIRWIGYLPQVEDKLVAGMELEEEQRACSDGTFNGQRYFTCPRGRGFFTLLQHCRQDARFPVVLPTKEKRLSTQIARGRDSQNGLELPQQAERYNMVEQLASALEAEKLKTEQFEMWQEQLEEELIFLQERLRQKKQQEANLQRQLRGKEQDVQELKVSLSTTQQALNEQRRQQPRDWVISQDEIHVTDKRLGTGGWGSVVEGTFRGYKVAVKKIHEEIISPHNRRLFEREMNMASRCRHPCLLQFIGATNDDGIPLFVTELMETSLKALLQQRPLPETEIFTISLDVAQALNYLHLNRPSPIIHRDISSANVLLWRQGDQWRGKVSDYGTANFMRHTMTVAPGAAIYCAPEALTSRQSTKVDVYSFGVLLCEMCIREMPDPQRRDQQIALVTSRILRGLIRRCVHSEPGTRPTMEDIISELEQHGAPL